jgi:O-antigen ligase
MLLALPVTLGLGCAGISRGMRGVRPVWRERFLWLSSPQASELILLFAAAGVMALALVMTMSRSGIGAMALAFALTAWFVIRGQGTVGRKAAAGIYIVLLAVLVAAWVGVDSIDARFAQTDWADINGRKGPWSDAWRIASLFPLTGTGLNTYGVATLFYQRVDPTAHYAQAHNDYLQLGAEGGLLLAVPAAACVALLVRDVRRRLREDRGASAYWIRAGAITGLVAMALQETVEFSLQMPGNAALFAVVCGLALHRSPARSASETATVRPKPDSTRGFESLSGAGTPDSGLGIRTSAQHENRFQNLSRVAANGAPRRARSALLARAPGGAVCGQDPPAVLKQLNDPQ